MNYHVDVEVKGFEGKLLWRTAFDVRGDTMADCYRNAQEGLIASAEWRQVLSGRTHFITRCAMSEISN